MLGTRAADMKPASAHGMHSPSVLIVDDTPANVGVLVDYLEDHGFRVVVAQDGEEGLRRAQFAQPDLILLDIMMPGMDGFETCRRLKATTNVKDIPVIFMTALTDTNEKVTAFGVGGVDYVTKPFQIEEVLARVNTHLALRAMQKQLAQQNVQLQQEVVVRLQAEAELRLTQYSVDHAADAVFWVAPDGGITYANDAACQMLEYSREDLLRMCAYEIEVGVTVDQWSVYWAQIKERRSYTVETKVRIKSGAVLPLEVTLNYFALDDKEYVFAYARDISERKRAEKSQLESYEKLQETNRKLEQLHQQLLQSEKMASIGQLAAGVAHEINNPIAFVNSNLGTLQDYVADLLQLVHVYERTDKLLDADPVLQKEIRLQHEKLDLDYLRADLKSLMDESLDGVQRVRRIVQDLKDFSHVGEVERQVVNLHPGIDSTLNIVWHEIKHKVQVKKEYGVIPEIEGVPAQLNQVFMNLLINASQAIEQNGVITIRTGAEEGFVWVEIGDTGCGIKPENLPRIFEPFFTTKPIGKGTGLGLSLSYGIITQHGGRIEVRSEIGAGSIFRVWLPIVAASTVAA
jgi:two-component system NtrC family sensor kinase